MNNQGGRDPDVPSSYDQGIGSEIFQKDVLESKANKPLSEKDFIHEPGPNPTPFPFWLWLVLFAVCILLLWRGIGWYQQFSVKEIEKRPFLEVTNRELSVFLWQFPGYLRSNAKAKTGYLTGFQSDKEYMDPQAAEEFAVAPPPLLFLYHTWHRLIANEWTPRPIPQEEFAEFLNAMEEWQPKYWKQAPQGYKELVEKLSTYKGQDLKSLSKDVLPTVVRQVFQGWKNYFKEGTAINNVKATYQEVEQFLKEHPHYVRSLWRNMEETLNQEVAGRYYLYNYVFEKGKPDEALPKDQVPPFLRVALFNYLQSLKGE